MGKKEKQANLSTRKRDETGDAKVDKNSLLCSWLRCRDPQLSSG